jgi:hypothetical protein
MMNFKEMKSLFPIVYSYHYTKTQRVTVQGIKIVIVETLHYENFEERKDEDNEQ